jgi:hypothetical protein
LGCVVGGLAGIDQDLLEFVIHAEVLEPSEHRKNVSGSGDNNYQCAERIEEVAVLNKSFMSNY